MTKKENNPNESGLNNRLLSALRHLLRPLVRLLVANGVSYPAFAEILKFLYVDVANREFRLDNKRQTHSRISLLTGVHRKDVKRLTESYGAAFAAPKHVSLGAQMVALWTSSPAYLDNSGKALPLARLANDGGAISFESLAHRVSKDVRARVVLDEWLRLGVVRLDEKDRVCLNVEAFVPRSGTEEKLFFFGQNIHDHLAAAVHNLSGAEPAFLERNVFYAELGDAESRELSRLAESAGMAALQAVNRSAAQLERRAARRKQKGDHRISFGIYFYREKRKKS